MSVNLNCQTFVVYRTSVEQKLKAKQTAHAIMKQMKNGSPKLRDLLREKCKIRIKEARQSRFESLRNFGDEEKSLIKRILQEEVAEFEKDIELQELIIKEMLEETTNWFIEELENEERNQNNYLIEMNESATAFCPICEKFKLNQKTNSLYCECGVSFLFNKSMEEFNVEIQKILEQHECKCDQKLNIFVEPNIQANGGQLNFLCDKCDYFQSLH